MHLPYTYVLQLHVLTAPLHSGTGCIAHGVPCTAYTAGCTVLFFGVFDDPISDELRYFRAESVFVALDECGKHLSGKDQEAGQPKAHSSSDSHISSAQMPQVVVRTYYCSNRLLKGQQTPFS